jgi:hypothetical protein
MQIAQVVGRCRELRTLRRYMKDMSALAFAVEADETTVLTWPRIRECHSVEARFGVKPAFVRGTRTCLDCRSPDRQEARP